MDIDGDQRKSAMSNRTGGIRMRKLLESTPPSRVGQCLDLYNMAVWDDVFVTVTTRVDQCNHYWVTVST